MSSYALLKENPDPTREEVRQWFKKHLNACRCTGYKPIVDAVMAAARVMRGECSIEDITYKDPADGAYYGTGVARPSAPAKATGLCDYGEDIALKMPAGTLHAVIVQPRITHHATLKNIDVSEAEAMPGVVKVVTYKDIRGTNRLALHGVRGRSTTYAPMRTILVEDRIFRYGDAVAVVVADTEEHARAAVPKVKIEIEQLPEYMSVLDVCMPGAIEIHKGFKNLINLSPKLKGVGDEDPAKVEELIDGSKYVVEGSFYSTPQPHLTIEGETLQAYWDEDDCLTVQGKCQNIYGDIELIGVAIGLPDEKVRIVTNPSGGSFGWSINPGGYALAAVCAMAVDNAHRPAHVLSGVHVLLRQAQRQHSNSKLGCDENGRSPAPWLISPSTTAATGMPNT